MYSLPNLRSSKERGAFPRRKPCTSTFCTSLRYALSEAFSSSSQLNSISRTASLVAVFSTETFFTIPPTGVYAKSIILYHRATHNLLTDCGYNKEIGKYREAI